MAIGDVLVRIRKERNLTQEDLARKLYVTRQAVSRWENGETTPGIDMCKLIAATCDVPVALLLEMPDGAYCQSCGMPFYQEKDHGTEADGSLSADYCSWCYANGAFLEDETLEELIERCAPFMAESCHITRDEAVFVHGRPAPHAQTLVAARTPRSAKRTRHLPFRTRLPPVCRDILDELCAQRHRGRAPPG